jgi:hypothetical protein
MACWSRSAKLADLRRELKTSNPRREGGYGGEDPINRWPRAAPQVYFLERGIYHYQGDGWVAPEVLP